MPRIHFLKIRCTLGRQPSAQHPKTVENGTTGGAQRNHQFERGKIGLAVGDHQIIAHLVLRSVAATLTDPVIARRKRLCATIRSPTWSKSGSTCAT